MVTQSTSQYFAELSSLLQSALRTGNPLDERKSNALIHDLCLYIYGGKYWEHDGHSRLASDEWMPKITRRSLLPLPSPSDLNFVSKLLQKTTLYSELTVLVCPDQAGRFERIGQAYFRGGYTGAIDQVLEANTRFSKLVGQGRCIFLPRRYRTEYMGDLKSEITELKAPLVQDKSDVKFLPLNQPLSVQTAERDLYLLHTIMLPYFPNASHEIIADIATEETDSFLRFTHMLASRIAAIGGADQTQSFADIAAEIDNEVAALRIEAKKIASSRALRGVEVTTFAVSIGALLLPNLPALSMLAGVAGSAALLDLAKGYAEARRTALDLKKSEFYIPYLLAEGS